jgi:hypothetical protein
MPAAQDDDRPLLLDEVGQKLDQFRLFRHSDEAAMDRVLDDLGAQGKVEHDMVLELSATRPLGHPERFAEAHALAMRALEVLDRNGARPPSQLKAGPLTPVAKWFVQQVIRFIVRSHQGRVIDSVRNLYTRRLAWWPAGDPDRLAFVRARLDAERATPSYKKSAAGLPTFLVGGAAVSSLATVAQRAVSSAVGSSAGRIALVVASLVLLAAASWVILRGSAVARRRIRLTMDAPLRALWETIGRCGEPPKDQSRVFALVGIALTAVGWLAIPLVIFLVVAVF